MEHSIDSWKDYYGHNDANETMPERISPVIECFCEAQLKLLGSSSLKSQTFSTKTVKDVAVCAEWLSDKTSTKYMGIGYSIVVSTINAVFKTIALHLVTTLKL